MLLIVMLQSIAEVHFAVAWDYGLAFLLWQLHGTFRYYESQSPDFVPVPRTSARPVSKVCGVFRDGVCVHLSTYERQTLTGMWRKGDYHSLF